MTARSPSRVPLPDGDTSSPGDSPHAHDLEVVRRILDGDASAWSAFIERYAGLILAMIRRYLRSRDQDDIRSIFTDILASLRRTRLRTYEGRAALSTWLTLVARSEVMDHLRRRFGRGLKSRAFERMSSAERTLFRLYYVEGRSRQEVLAALRADGGEWGDDRFIATLHHIERQLGDRWLMRLSYDLHAQSTGAASGRLLEYLDHVRDELDQHAGTYSPEYHLMEREARRTVDQLRAAVATLDAPDRRLLELRFECGWTARKIASELGLEGQRSVYSALERIVRTLRRQFAGGDDARR